MALKLNRVRQAVSGTPGTGTITLGTVAGGYQSFAQAGGLDGSSYNYIVEDGGSWEYGTGVLGSSATTLARTLLDSSTNALLNLTSGAIVSCDLFAEDVTSATAAQVRGATNDVAPVTGKSLADASAFITLTDATTIAWDMSTGFNAKVTLGGTPRTMGTPTNPKEGFTYVLQIIQDATGGRTIGTWPALTIFDWGSAGVPTLSTAANKIDIVTLLCLNTSTPLFRAAFNKAA